MDTTPFINYCQRPVFANLEGCHQNLRAFRIDLPLEAQIAKIASESTSIADHMKHLCPLEHITVSPAAIILLDFLKGLNSIDVL